jgi:hypothetical protein
MMGLAMLAGAASESTAQVLYSENFEGVTLGDSVNERRSTVPVLGTRLAGAPNTTPVPNVLSKTAPTGWTIDNALASFNGAPTIGNAGVPGLGQAAFGVDEWEGWSFVDKNFWSTAAGDQNRSQFALASGTVAVVDPDEYFDLPGADTDNTTFGGYYNSGLSTPSIPYDPTAAGVGINFVSSWRPESLDDDYGTNPALNNTNNQSVEVFALFNTGERISGLVWDSDPASPTFKADATNELVQLVLPAPTTPGATSYQVFFNMANAANDWWWAIDNIEIGDFDGVNLVTVPVLTQNFDSIPLGPSVNENNGFSIVTRVNNDANSAPIPGVVSKTPPAGSSVDSTGTPGLGDDNIGVFDWEGWSFVNKDFWNEANGQNRGLFTRGQGVVAVADGDDWDDLGNPDGSGSGVTEPQKTPLQTVFETPAIDTSGLTPGEQQLEITFDSSWRAEDLQTAVLTAVTANGSTELFRWESVAASPLFKASNLDEAVTLVFDPQGAPTTSLRFSYRGNDDWWWAIDNVSVSVIPEPTSAALLGLASVAGLGFVRRR